VCHGIHARKTTLMQSRYLEYLESRKVVECRKCDNIIGIFFVSCVLAGRIQTKRGEYLDTNLGPREIFKWGLETLIFIKSLIDIPSTVFNIIYHIQS